MGVDIYGSSPSFGGAFSADEAVLTFELESGSDGGLGFLTQGMNARYARPVQRIFELGPQKRTYYVVGRAEGALSISRLAAPAPVSQNFLTRYANVCNVKKNNITVTANPGTNPDCPPENTTPSRYMFRFCLITNLAFGISVQAITLNEQIDLMFSSMETDNES